MTLTHDIEQTINRAHSDTQVRDAYRTRLAEGALTREENAGSHFCVYFLPYNPARKEVFLVHHKKAGLWISPGGHVDHGERLFATMTREVGEELGATHTLPANTLPQMISISGTAAASRPCEVHYDMWYFLPMNGDNFNVDMSEFHDTRWFSVSDAFRIVSDRNNTEAIKFIFDTERLLGGETSK